MDDDLRYISDDTSKLISRYVISNDDVYISIAGTIGKTGIVPQHLDGSNLTENAAKITNIIGSYNKYLHLLLNTDDLKTQIGRSMKATSQPKLALHRIQELIIPLPPLNEQKRIVDKVERLLDKINQAKKLVEEVKKTFELRRAAILDKAFRGKLTANWREKNLKQDSTPDNELEDNDIPKEWVITKFNSLAAKEKHALAIGPFGSNLKVSDYQDQGVPLIFIRNIRSADYNKNRKYVSEEKADELRAHTVTSGDVLITKMGDPPGDSDLCPEYTEKAIITADCIKLRVNSKLANNKFIMYAVRSPFVRKQIAMETKGVAQQKISLQLFKEMKVMLPSLEEQFMVVERLEKLLNAEQDTAKLLQLVEEKLKVLENAILSKAFCGELGTNNQSESNVIEILKDIIITVG